MDHSEIRSFYEHFFFPFGDLHFSHLFSRTNSLLNLSLPKGFQVNALWRFAGGNFDTPSQLHGNGIQWTGFKFQNNEKPLNLYFAKTNLSDFKFSEVPAENTLDPPPETVSDLNAASHSTLPDSLSSYDSKDIFLRPYFVTANICPSRSKISFRPFVLVSLNPWTNIDSYLISQKKSLLTLAYEGAFDSYGQASHRVTLHHARPNTTDAGLLYDEQGTVASNISGWFNEASFENDSREGSPKRFGIRAMYHFGASTVSIFQSLFKNVKAAIGGEAYYSVRDKSGNLSLGFLLTKKDSNDHIQLKENTFSMALNPFMGHLTAAYFIPLTSSFSLASAYDFNMFSLESDFSLAFELSKKVHQGYEEL